MSEERAKAQARRVIAGVDNNGKSTIVSDENTATRVALPSFTVNDVWRVDNLPAGVGDQDTLSGEVQLHPPKNGLVVRLATFLPDSWLNPEEAMGMHFTDTVDVVTVVSGEIYAILETGETLLRPGDTIINRGNKHAWSNRSEAPATVVATMLPVKR
jgi:hypothetical protein